MIRWCCYCQRLMGETPPLTSFDLTHGICEACDARLEADANLVAEYDGVIRFFKELFAAGRAGDLSACRELVTRSRVQGFGVTEVLVGLLQPALTKIGRLWETTEIGVADEHRFTTWCESVLALLEPQSSSCATLDLLLLVAPGNHHVLGPRFAEQVLLAHGLSALSVVPDLPLEEVARLAKERRAAWVGYSCALPHQVASAMESIDKLTRGGFQGRFMLAGQALRRSPELGSHGAVQVCLTVEEAERVMRLGPTSSAAVVAP
jgi:methanogenic corrinoid protein MtbC1